MGRAEERTGDPPSRRECAARADSRPVGRWEAEGLTISADRTMCAVVTADVL